MERTTTNSLVPFQPFQLGRMKLRHPPPASVKALVRSATVKRLTNRLPKLSLITLSPPLNSGILGLRMGPYVPTPKFFYNLWGPRESDSFVKALVRWATGKRLTNRLPKLSLITSSSGSSSSSSSSSRWSPRENTVQDTY